MPALRIFLIAILLLVATLPAEAGSLRVKLATLAPDGSPWHKQLEGMGNEWQESTDGRLRLLIYPGGVAGSDGDMVRKMRIGQLQAAALTIEGLAGIDNSFLVFTVPLFFESFEEYAYVLEQMTPALSERLAAKGFVLVHWGHGGWIHLFSKTPVRGVADLKKLKMFTPAGDDRMVGVWQSNGFRPVALATTDVLYGLKTGLIEGIPVPPLAALALQWFRHTPYMLDEGVAPLLGATVVSAKAWARISESDRKVLFAAGERVEESLAREIPAKDRTSVEEMKKRGLTVIHLEDDEREARWAPAARAFAEGMQGMIPEEIFEQALRHRGDYRQARSEEGQP